MTTIGEYHAFYTYIHRVNIDITHQPKLRVYFTKHPFPPPHSSEKQAQKVGK